MCVGVHVCLYAHLGWQRAALTAAKLLAGFSFIFSFFFCFLDLFLSPSLSLSPLSLSLSLSPPRSPPTVWTAVVSPQPPVFLLAASAGEGSPSGKKLSSPPLPPPTLPVWLTPASGTPAHTHAHTHTHTHKHPHRGMRCGVLL